MDAARLAVCGKFKMVMLQVGEAVAHMLFTAGDFPLPQRGSAALDVDFSGNVAEVTVNNQLWTDTACAQLGAGEIQIIALLEFVVGKLIAICESKANRVAVLIDEIDAC